MGQPDSNYLNETVYIKKTRNTPTAADFGGNIMVNMRQGKRNNPNSFRRESLQTLIWQLYQRRKDI